MSSGLPLSIFVRVASEFLYCGTTYILKKGVCKNNNTINTRSTTLAITAYFPGSPPLQAYPIFKAAGSPYGVITPPVEIVQVVVPVVPMAAGSATYVYAPEPIVHVYENPA